MSFTRPYQSSLFIFARDEDGQLFKDKLMQSKMLVQEDTAYLSISTDNTILRCTIIFEMQPADEDRKHVPIIYSLYYTGKLVARTKDFRNCSAENNLQTSYHEVHALPPNLQQSSVFYLGHRQPNDLVFTHLSYLSINREDCHYVADLHSWAVNVYGNRFNIREAPYLADFRSDPHRRQELIYNGKVVADSCHYFISDKWRFAYSAEDIAIANNSIINLLQHPMQISKYLQATGTFKGCQNSFKQDKFKQYQIINLSPNILKYFEFSAFDDEQFQQLTNLLKYSNSLEKISLPAFTCNKATLLAFLTELAQLDHFQQLVMQSKHFPLTANDLKGLPKLKYGISVPYKASCEDPQYRRAQLLLNLYTHNDLASSWDNAEINLAQSLQTFASPVFKRNPDRQEDADINLHATLNI